MNLILSLVFVVSKFIVAESSINKTLLSSFPPLYALDEWSHCQEPGDEYCVVHAALVSREPSSLLDAIKEYSSDEQTRYDRSIIHRGVCISRYRPPGADSPGQRRETAQRCVNQSVAEYGLEAAVLAVHSCGTAGRPPQRRAAAALAGFCLLLAAAAAAATALHALGDQCGSIAGNEYVLAFSLKRNWATLTRDSSEPSRMKNIAYLGIVRFAGLLVVMLCHVVFFYHLAFNDDPEFIENMYDNFLGMALFNVPMYLQSFFCISGLLMAYSVITTSERSTFTFKKCVLAIINRWIRLTPVKLVTLWADVSWMPLAGAGPLWAYFVESHAQLCAEGWWYHALNINNFAGERLCMLHTWYLAVDMQLFSAGVLLMLLLSRWRWAAGPTLALLLGGVLGAAAAVTYQYDLKPVGAMQTPEFFQKGIQNNKELVLMYLPAWANSPGYILGVATAFVLRALEKRDVKLNQFKWFRLAWWVAPALAAGVPLAGAWAGRAPRWAVLAYAAAGRALYSAFFCVFLLGLAAQYKSATPPQRAAAPLAASERAPLSELLSVSFLALISQSKSAAEGALRWRGWAALGRLSFSAYVLHVSVMRLYVAVHVRLLHLSLYSILFQLCVAVVITYILSVPVYLLIELPAIQLCKAIFTSRNKEKTNQKSEV